MKNSSFYSDDLKVLCIEIIKCLDKLKSQGIITEEDYIKHTKLKKKFLDDIQKKSC
ncbi:hypothetical protein [Clostridiisalibacter paucivorans]|uniref:hypothetical protein n=1 Tax=Clostridiisalibacter paucivorans TaxID=408753 RepID=UPI0012EBE4D1|nr:hypothetical protein [Clostridiisalibacter paucivorans]